MLLVVLWLLFRIKIQLNILCDIFMFEYWKKWKLLAERLQKKRMLLLLQEILLNKMEGKELMHLEQIFSVKDNEWIICKILWFEQKKVWNDQMWLKRHTEFVTDLH